MAKMQEAVDGIGPVIRLQGLDQHLVAAEEHGHHVPDMAMGNPTRTQRTSDSIPTKIGSKMEGRGLGERVRRPIPGGFRNPIPGRAHKSADCWRATRTVLRGWGD